MKSLTWSPKWIKYFEFKSELRSFERKTLAKRFFSKHMVLNFLQDRIIRNTRKLNNKYATKIILCDNFPENSSSINSIKPLTLFLNRCKNLKRLCFQILNAHSRLSQLISNGIFKKLRLKKLINLSSVIKSCVMHPRIISTMLKNFDVSRKIKSIKMDFEQCKYSSDRDIKILSSKLKRFRDIEELRLSFTWNARINEDFQLSLAEAISQLRHLKHFVFRIPGCKNASPQGAFKLFQVLSKRKFETLYFDFIRSSCINSISMAMMKNMLKTQTHLKNLGLKLSGSANFESNYLKQMVEVICKLETLKIFHLNLENAFFFTPFLMTYATKYMGQLNRLEELTLNFPESKDFQDQDFAEFFRKFADFKKLRSLSIHTERCYNIGDQAIKQLALAISEINALYLFFANFGFQNDITYQGMETLRTSCANSLIKHVKISPCLKRDITLNNQLSQNEVYKTILLVSVHRQRMCIESQLFQKL